MNNDLRSSSSRLNSISILVGLLCNFCAWAEDPVGIWSQKGMSPVVNSAKSQSSFAPGGRMKIVGTEAGLRLDSVGSRQVLLPVVATAPLWEVIWAPSAKYVAVNASDGGVVGTWDATIYDLHHEGNPAEILIGDLIRTAAGSWPNCESPEDVNVAVVGWTNQSAEALVIAEVPPHSTCVNGGALTGFRVEIKSKRIVGRLSEVQLRKRWAALLGPRFH